MNVALIYRDWRNVRSAQQHKRADQLRYAAGNTVLTNQFASITSVFHAAIAMAAALYALELILATSYATSMLHEDGVIETATAIVFLSAGVIGFGHFVIDRRRVSLAIGVLGVVAFLDELSFGERLFGYDPLAVRGIRIDAAHDLLDLGFSMAVTRFSPTQLMVIACGMCVGVAVTAYCYRARVKALWGCSRVVPFIAFTVLALALAYVIDEGFENTSIGNWLPVASFEELFEFVAAVSISCAASIRALEISVYRTRSVFHRLFADSSVGVWNALPDAH